MLYQHVLHLHTAVEIVINKDIQVVLICSITAQMTFKISHFLLQISEDYYSQKVTLSSFGHTPANLMYLSPFLTTITV